MQVTHNEYFPHVAGSAMLRITSKKTGVHDVIVDSVLVSVLEKFTWCFEDSKTLCYTMDMHMETAGKIFNYSTPRIYLWKYVLYLTVGCIHGSWIRRDKLDYRSASGILKPHPLCS